MSAATNRAGDLRATTLDGFIARAKAIVFYTPDHMNTDRIQGEDERMIATLLRDLVAGGAA